MARNYEKNELLSVEECCAPRQVNNTIQNNQTKNDATLRDYYVTFGDWLDTIAEKY